MGWIARTSTSFRRCARSSELRRHRRPLAPAKRVARLRYDLDDIERRLAVFAHVRRQYAALPSYDEILRRNTGAGLHASRAGLYMLLRAGSHRVTWGSARDVDHYAQLAAGETPPRPALSITAIDPFASDVACLGAWMCARKKRRTPVDFAALGKATLFIDSTHIVRVDGEVPYLVLEVLPALASSGAHHDVHLLTCRSIRRHVYNLIAAALYRGDAGAGVPGLQPARRDRALDATAAAFREYVLAVDFRLSTTLQSELRNHHGSLWLLYRAQRLARQDLDRRGGTHAAAARDGLHHHRAGRRRRRHRR